MGALQRVDAWDEECRGSFAVRAGVTYHVAVDGLARNRDYGTGPVRIAVAYTASATEPAGGAAVVSPPPATTVTTTPETSAVASLSIAKSGPLTARVDRRGRFSIKAARLSCAAAQTACTARVEVRTRRRGGRRLGGATLTIDPSHDRALRARLRRPARERLARRGRLAVWLRVALGDGAPVAKRVTLLRRNAG